MGMEKEEEMAGAVGKEEMAEATVKEEKAGATVKQEKVGATVKQEKENSDDERDKKSAGAQHEGSILLRAKENQIVLPETDETVIDARYLREGELIYPGLMLQFPCYTVNVAERILQPDACIEDEDVVTPVPVTSAQLLSSATEPKLVGNADDRVVDKENHPPSKRTKQKRKGGNKSKKRKLEEIREESDEEDPLLPRGAENAKLPVDIEEQEPPSRCRTKQERRDEKRRKMLKVDKIRKRKRPDESSEYAEELRRKNRDTIKKRNKEKYPVLSRIARDVLAVQASNVASESAFSTGGRVVSDYRSRLTISTVESLICLHDWLRAADPSQVNKTTTADLDDEECQILVTMPTNPAENVPDH